MRIVASENEYNKKKEEEHFEIINLQLIVKSKWRGAHIHSTSDENLFHVFVCIWISSSGSCNA